MNEHESLTVMSLRVLRVESSMLCFFQHIDQSNAGPDTKAKPFMVSISLEFDASSFKTRVRKGMLVAEAKYHVLATLTKQHDSDNPSTCILN